MTGVADRATVRVAVGVLQRPDGQVLVAERTADRHAGGGLEFPGGKCDAGEAATDALDRELAEELGIAVQHAEPLIRVRHAYADRSVELDTYRVDAWRGTPRGAEGQAVHWRRVDALSADDFPAANRPIIAALHWPACCLVTPDRDAVPDPDALFAGVEAALARGTVGAVQLRRADRGSGEWWSLVERLALLCDDHGARLLVNADPASADALPSGAGLHLRSAALARLDRRPVAAGVPLSCSAHDAAELRAAAAIDVDCAFLGPVHPTVSHPGAAALGWPGFAELAAVSAVPLYALGGLGPEALARARRAGAIGVAGIGRFWSGSGEAAGGPG